MQDQFSDAKEAAGNLYEIVETFLCSHHVPKAFSTPIAGLLAGAVLVAGGVYAIVIALTVHIAPEFAKAVLKIISDVRRQGIPEFNSLASAVLSEFLGFEMPESSVSEGTGLEGAKKRAQQIGALLHETLLKEFAGSHPIKPEDGKAAAERFSGFAINFAIANSTVAILAELMSFGKFEEFRELGVEVAQNLGLGRLQRGALKPVIDNLISKPYAALIQKEYRPDALTEQQFVKALHRGQLPLEHIQERLAEKGYRDEYIAEIIAQLTAHLSDVEVEALIRYGAITGEAGVAQLKAEGWPEESARLKLRAVMLGRVDSLVGATLAAYEKAALERWIDTEAFGAIVDQMPLSEDEKVWWRRRLGAQLELPRKRPTFAQVEKLFADGIVTMDYVDLFLEAEGYSFEDALNLQLLMLLTIEKQVEKEQEKKKKHARAATRKTAKTTTLQSVQ